MHALPFQAPAPHVYIRMRQANIENRQSKSWPKKILRVRYIPYAYGIKYAYGTEHKHRDCR